MKYIPTLAILITCIIACIAGIVVLHLKVISVWNDVAVRQQQLDAAPKEQAQVAAMKRDLALAQIRFTDLQKMTVTRDGLADVVVAISQASLDSGVIAQVPEVGQSKGKDAAAPSEGDSLQDVRISVSATGDPAALVAFLYRIEQLPYLLYVATSSIDTTHQVALKSLAVGSIPTNTPDNSGPPVLATSLNAEIIVTITR